KDHGPRRRQFPARGNCDSPGWITDCQRLGGSIVSSAWQGAHMADPDEEAAGRGWAEFGQDQNDGSGRAAEGAKPSEKGTPDGGRGGDCGKSKCGYEGAERAAARGKGGAGAVAFALGGDAPGGQVEGELFGVGSICT